MLKGMCYSHFGNDDSNGAISIMKCFFMITVKQTLLGDNHSGLVFLEL